MFADVDLQQIVIWCDCSIAIGTEWFGSDYEFLGWEFGGVFIWGLCAEF